MQLSYDEILEVLDIKNLPPKRTRYTIPPGVYEISHNNLMLNSLIPKEVEANITIDDNGIKSNIKNYQTLVFTKGSFFFYTILGFTQSNSGPLGDIEGVIQLIPGTYNSDKPINITAIDKIHLKADCISGSIVNGIR